MLFLQMVLDLADAQSLKEFKDQLMRIIRDIFKRILDGNKTLI